MNVLKHKADLCWFVELFDQVLKSGGRNLSPIIFLLVTPLKNFEEGIYMLIFLLEL